MAARILVVDDDRQIVRLLETYLTKEGMNVLTAFDGNEAWRIIRRECPDLVLLDLMLPGRDGREIARAVRADEQLARTPIVMLTARVDDSDKLHGFELGADDYVTKPFNPAEVVARVRAVLRRVSGSPLSAALQVGGIRLDPDQHIASVDGRTLDLTPSEFSLLQALMENANHVLTRTELIARALGYEYEGMERTVDSHIKNLRKKLKTDPAHPATIETVFGIGYRMSGSALEER